MNAVRVLLFFYLLAVSANAKSQQNLGMDSLMRFAQQKGDSLFKAEKLPGLFIAVQNRGQWALNFGYAVPEQNLPFTDNTLFEAGSITKTFTAFVVESVLRDKGIADTSSILRFLPDSVRRNKALASVSFLSLLNHTSGLPRLPDNMPVIEGDRRPYDSYTEAELFSYLKSAVPKPDGKSNYSNLGMGLAGVLAGRITGKDYATLLNDYILTPFFISSGDDRSKYAKSQGHFADGSKTPYWNMAALAPAGSLQCTAAEMLHYLRYMSQPLDPKSKAVIDRLLQPTASLSPAIRIGRGWHTLEREGKPTIYWHNGGTYGFSTFAAFIRARNKP